ncbi:hypothetical protein GCM10023219_11860 [Stakelama sediminis]|uniref:Uncharacterized protein n=1 Tax=Stakelama sediminis TaxID=463200 RepID=A0A840YWH5_9SPHN|nr:hypothetical protein [Stakelama sediminis]MBB5717910.1 hypothetical protein [Stakelama sediminis]
MQLATETETPLRPQGQPGRARALLSTADFHLLRTALGAYAKQIEDEHELARIKALYHRLGAYS